LQPPKKQNEQKIISIVSVFQNSVSFGKRFRKTGLKADFSEISKIVFPKTRTFGSKVLEKPLVIVFFTM